MEFTNLMVIRSSPVYWDVKPRQRAEQVRDFLQFLLDPSWPGVAAMGVADGQETRWLQGEGATTWVDEVYKEIWLPVGDVLEERGRDGREEAFNRLQQHTTEVFADRERYEACLRAILGEVPAEALLRSPSGQAVDQDYFVGFSFRWFGGSDYLLWLPLPRFSNFWPSDRRYAPNPPGHVAPPVIDASQAADSLEHWLYERLGASFRLSLEHYDVGTSAVRIGSRTFLSPTFYYAEPAEMPAEPEDFLKPPSVRAIRRLSRIVLGTDDPASAGVLGGFLQGNLVTLRREMVGDTVQSLYLVIPWWSGDGQDGIEEAEGDAMFVAKTLSRVEFAAAYTGSRLSTDLETAQVKMALWGKTLGDAARLVRSMQSCLVSEAPGSHRRKDVFRLVNRMATSLARLEGEMLRVTNNVMILEPRFRADLEKNAMFSRRDLTSRPLPGVRHLLDSVGEFFAYRVLIDRVPRQAQSAQQLRDTFHRSESAIRDLSDQEAREDREREELQREHDRQRDERRQRILGYGLAALAAITAFPILIGQMGWGELRQVISVWPWPFIWLGNLLSTFHPWMVLVAVIAAGGAISVLLGILLWTLWRPTRLPQEGVEEDRLPAVLGKVVQVWRLFERSQSIVKQLSREARVSPRGPGGETQEIRGVRRQVDGWDTEACQRLVEVWEWLGSQGQTAEASGHEELQGLARDVDRFVVLAELLDNRPDTPLPLALCVFRYKSTDFVRSTVVSELVSQVVV